MVGRIAIGLSALALCLPAAALSATRLPGFHSPSGNIKCVYIPEVPMLLCEIGHSGYAKALQKRCMTASGAGLDWHGFTLTTRRGGVNCSGGIQYNPATQQPFYANLRYGKSWRHGAFTCDSGISGVTCRTAHGHGLFISRDSWRAW